MRKVLFACDSFKGTIPSFKVGEAAELGFRQYGLPGSCKPGVVSGSLAEKPEKTGPIATFSDATREFFHCPMSDGGGGLIDSLTFRRGKGGILKVNLQRIDIPLSYPIHGPLGEVIPPPVSFACDALKGILVVEMAEAAGLARIASASQRSPWEATSYGVGEMILYALEHMGNEIQKKEGAGVASGVTLLLGIGGSATNDGGLGALQALGLDIFVEDPATYSVSLLEEPFKGKHLQQLNYVRVSDKLKEFFAFSGFHQEKNRNEKTLKCFVDKMFLICDVENPLVGPQGATYIFGPQKCSPVVAGSTNSDDAAVGTVKSAAQKQMLDQLEAGMRQAGSRVVSSTWQTLFFSRGAKCSTEIDVTQIEKELLHGPRGGGAGGMSGFFRYMLGTSCLPGADIVAALQGLRTVERMPWETRESAPEGLTTVPSGSLFDGWDTLVTGEGSFDAQSIFSRKTVGRLLEMVIEANAWRWKRELGAGEETTRTKNPSGLLQDVIVVCGRSGFSNLKEVYEALKFTVLKKPSPDLLKWIKAISVSEKIAVEDIFQRLLPRITILALTDQFSVQEAMKDPYTCIAQVVKNFLSKNSTEPHSTL